VFGAKAQPASFLGDFCNKICHKPTYAVQQKRSERIPFLPAITETL